MPALECGLSDVSCEVATGDGALLDLMPFEQEAEVFEVLIADQFRQAFEGVLHGRALLVAGVNASEALGQRVKLGIDLLFYGKGHWAAPSESVVRT
ncbi:hypothetical protein [Shinella zoogloeoides]|uniref:hypothetical protein n=1 Tax=Shinella zoogloeoides TaxID=352475 RepID=UPI00299E2657|nr:hypothetical protein [Shinella zoogloeoides]